MGRNPSDKDEQELQRIAESHFAEWQRIEREILSNATLMRDIRAMRKQYNLPCTTFKAHVDWFDSQNVDTILKYQDEIDRLAKLYGFDTNKGKRTIRSLIEFGKTVQWKEGPMGFPTMRPVIKDKVLLGFEPVIDTDTATDNPIVLDFIQDERRKLLLRSNPPPRPQPMKDNPRKLDWRPLWEWSKRHPDVTRDEIAKHLGYRPQRVRLKLAELDTDK